jgi:hypothetical protein
VTEYEEKSLKLLEEIRELQRQQLRHHMPISVPVMPTTGWKAVPTETGGVVTMTYVPPWYPNTVPSNAGIYPTFTVRGATHA